MAGFPRRTIAWISALTLLAGACLLAWFVFELYTPYCGWQEEAVVVDLPRGLDAGAMLERLHASGVVRRPGLVRLWLKLRGSADDLKAGEYRFDRPLSATEAVAMLERGDVVLHAVTLPEGLDADAIADRLAAAGFGEGPALREAFRDPTPIRDLDPAASDLEGYLYPDTYHFPRAESPGRIAATLVDRFRAVVGPDYAGRAEALGLTVREGVILASMIEKETAVPEERWRISRVFHNRLKRGMKLQCDPTVLYALKRAGRSVERLTFADLEFDSPWNTYRVDGLPPGPICNPGRDSLDAAVNPSEGEELYFVASPGGGHTFSRDLVSHLRAVRDWRRYQRSSR